MAVSFRTQLTRYFSTPHEQVPTEPVASPAAWTGAELRNQDIAHVFTAEEIAELELVARGLLDAGASVEDIGADDFPLEVARPKLDTAMHDVRYGRGFAMLRGLPVARWGEQLTSIVYWGIGQHLGEPGEQNPAGERLGHVVDYGEEASHPLVRRYRTTGNIDFHCDGADVVGLLCLRTARVGGQSRIASSVTIFNALLDEHPELVPHLFETMYLDRRDEEPPGQAPCTPLQPARYARGQLSTFYHSEYFRSADRHAGYELDSGRRALLDAYDGIAAREEVYLDLWLEPGDLQLVCNHVIVHARTAYEDHDDPALKRHLLRLWLSFHDG